MPREKKNAVARLTPEQVISVLSEDLHDMQLRKHTRMSDELAAVFEQRIACYRWAIDRLWALHRRVRRPTGE